MTTITPAGSLRLQRSAPMKLQTIMDTHRFVALEAAVIETLKRSGKVPLHPRLDNALLIYSTDGEKALRDLYGGFIDVARRGRVPIAVCTPTWRANRERLSEAGITDEVNKDAAAFMIDLRDRWGDWADKILIGGLVGCKNDGYKPEEGLSKTEAKPFHRWQVRRLAHAGVDFLLGATLPAAPEATGMALAMSETDLPYIVSFVINRDGRILDGNSLEHTFREIDAVCDRPPFGFMVNCAHPSFLRAHRQPHSVLRRLVGFQANASSLDHSRLDGSAALQADDLEHWGRQMVALNHRFGIKMLGGCCGTRMAHLELLVERAPVFDLLTSLKSRFQADRKRITDAIGSYPAPIPPCDAQFNHLLEERRRLSRALNLVGALLSLPESSPSVIQAAESLIAHLDLFDEDAADRLRSAFQSQRGQDLGGRSDPS